MSKGDQTTTSTTAPSPQAAAAYSKLMERAQNVSDQPWVPFTGEAVAPLTQEQILGTNTINAYANAANNYYGLAGGAMRDAGAPLTYDQIMSYYSPYTQNVTDKARAAFAQTNAENINKIKGNEAASGALGGDRGAVAQAAYYGSVLPGQDAQLAQIQMDAYNKAVATAQQQYQQNPIAFGLAMGQLGTNAQTAGLQGGFAQMGAGQVEQQTKQQQDYFNISQYLAKQGYDFQTTQWLAGLLTGVGSQMGGTSSTTGPPPNWLGQAIGAGAGLGTLGLMYMNEKDGGRVNAANGGGIAGGFDEDYVPDMGMTMGPGPPKPPAPPKPDTSGQDFMGTIMKMAPMIMMASEGGAVGPDDALLGFQGGGAPGGGLGSPYGAAGGGSNPFTLQYIPTAQIHPGHGAPQAPAAPKQQGIGDSIAKNAAQMAQVLSKMGKDDDEDKTTNTAVPDILAPVTGGDERLQPAAPESAGLDLSNTYAFDPYDFGVGLYSKKGGRINLPGGLALPGHNRIVMPMRAGMGMPSFVKGYQGGGTPFVDRWPFAKDSPDNIEADGEDPRRVLAANMVPTERIVENVPMPRERPPGPLPKVITQGPEGDDTEGSVDGVGTATAFTAPEKRGLVTPQQSPPDADTEELAPRSKVKRPVVTDSGVGRLGIRRDVLPALASGFFGMAAAASQPGASTLGSFAQGANLGLGSYYAGKKAQADVEMESRKLDEQARYHSAQIALQTRKAAQENLQYIGNNDDGFPIYLDRKSGKEVVGTMKVQQKAPSGYVRNPDGTMSAVKGGPADPEVIAGLQKAKAGAAMPDATADFLAERIIAGDAKALVGLGRGAQGPENIVRVQGLVAQKAAERGLNANDLLARVAEQSGLVASQRTFGTQIARMAVNSTEAQGAIQQGLEVSKNVPRGSWVPITKLVQMSAANISDPDLLEFRAANLAIINTYARAINPTGQSTIHDKEEAMKIVSEATSPEAYERVMHRMLKEIEIAHAAPAVAKRELERIRKSGSATDAQKPAVREPQVSGAKPSLQEFLDKARAEKANDRYSDQDLTDYYNKKYGGI